MRLTIIILFSLLTFSSKGQSLYNNGMTISIKPNTIVSVGTNATNNGTVINNGNLMIAGSWQNNGTYNAGNGTFTLNSGGSQIVNHNAQSFEHLIISGGGVKIFEADITVNNHLELVNGILSSEKGAKLIIAPGGQLSGGSSTAYVVGPLVMSAENNVTYPIGTAGQYLPVQLSEIAGIGVVISIEALSPNPITAFDENEAMSISSTHSWKMDTDGDSFTGARITLPVLEEPFITDISEALVMYATDLSSEYNSLGTSATPGNPIEDAVTSSQPANAGYLTLGLKHTPAGEGLPIHVINAITPATLDGKHDFLKIENIEQYPDNKVSIYSRWGDLVYEVLGYNNADITFTGNRNRGGSEALEAGTYFYAIDAGSEVTTGFFVINK